MDETKPTALGHDLSHKQRKAAEALLAIRPAVLPGTRAIIDEAKEKEWYDKVTTKVLRLGLSPEQVAAFCDIAGVPD
jgi:hypothetical protein